VSVAVIFLNGASSSGKSTIARCLQELLPAPAVAIGIDSLLETIPLRLFGDDDGIAFLPDGTIRTGAAFERLAAAWRHAVAALARQVPPVIVDEVFLTGAAAQEEWCAALDGLEVLWVGVRCDTATAAAREESRGDRTIGLARMQTDLVHRGVRYSVEVDTTRRGAAECAQTIVAALNVRASGATRGRAATPPRRSARGRRQ
jgi:chloramphenicol 3-O phosphotransferase